jgi:hypothetical protein
MNKIKCTDVLDGECVSPRKKVAWGLEIFMLLIWLCLPSKLGDY